MVSALPVRRRPALLRALCLVLAGSLSTAASLAAQASPYVSPQDPAYRDLAALVSVGLVHDVLTADRTRSRKAFARFIREAQGNVTAGAPRADRVRFQEALKRLEDRFAPELRALCDQGDRGDRGDQGDQGDRACTPPATAVRLQEASADATLARSPGRAIPTSYNSNSYIDATLNPLLQENQGRVLADGWTAAAESEVDAQLGSAFVASARARLWALDERGPGTSADAALQRGYVRTVLGNLSVEAGRDYVTQGQGRDGGTLFSDNARALDMVRISDDRAFRLPGLLRPLGLFHAYGLVGDLGANRDTPHAKVISFGWSWRPSPYFEGGATLENVQGGTGAPAATLRERLDDIFLWFFGGTHQRDAFSDKVANVNGRITVPSAGLDLYLDLSTTDINWRRWETLGDEAAWLVGGKLSGLGDEGRYDVWLEWHRTGVRPYTHHQFTSGQTLDGRVLGDATGPMTTALHAGVDWQGRDQTVSVSEAWERYRGDTYVNNGLRNTRYRWIRVADNPDEIRLRTRVDWTRHAGDSGRFTQVSLGYEHVTRFDFTDRGRNNVVAQVRVGVRR